MTTSRPYACHAVRRFDRRTRRALEVLASGLTLDEASRLAESARTEDAENEHLHGYQVTTMTLTEQAAIMDAAEAPVEAPSGTATTAARLANAARAVALRTAHAAARLGDASVPYAARLAAALHAPAVRRCSLARLRAQAAEFVALCEASGARFNVVDKAVQALTFSADMDARGLCVPSKLVGVSAYQDAAAAVGSRLDSRGGWVLTEQDEATVYALGMRLGDVQSKHARTWLAALGGTGNGPCVRVAVAQVTGGRAIVTAGGQAVTTTRGVNVAFEVGPALAQRIEARRLQARRDDIDAGRLVEVGPGCFVTPSSVVSSLAWVARNGGHARAWGRLD